MKLWDVSKDGQPWKVELDVRDLGGHLDFTRRAWAGTLSKRVKDATHGVVAIGALPLGFQVKLGLVRGEYLPAGLLAVEASYVSACSLSSFRAAIVRSVWSSKMPLQVPWLSVICWMVQLEWTLLFLTLSGAGSVLCGGIWLIGQMRSLVSFVCFALLRMRRRGMAQCMCLISAAELGFAWDGGEQGWIQAALLPLRTLIWPNQHFQTAIF